MPYSIKSCHFRDKYHMDHPHQDFENFDSECQQQEHDNYRKDQPHLNDQDQKQDEDQQAKFEDFSDSVVDQHQLKTDEQQVMKDETCLKTPESFYLCTNLEIH